MSLSELAFGCFGVAAALLQCCGFLVMAAALARGTARPNPVSWLIWSVVATLAAVGSWQAGATWPLAGAAMNAVGCIAILVMALKRGTFCMVSWTDLACLLGAAAGLAAWSVSGDPATGLMLFLAADACGALPTIRNVVLDHRSESVRGWVLLALAEIAAVVSVEHHQWLWSWQGFGYWGGAVYVAMVNVMIAAMLFAVSLARGRFSVPRVSGQRTLG